MSASRSVLIIGAGLFGLTAAVELARRGCAVQVVEPGPIPHPDAASSDISKVVRMEYAADAFYSRWMLEGLEGWRRWNARWNERVFHETGVLMMARAPLEPGGFEWESLTVLASLGCKPERIDSALLHIRYPAWNPEQYVDGFFHALGGYARSDRTIMRLAGEAQSLGVGLLMGLRVEGLIEEGRTIRGARCAGRRLEADETLLATGAWTATLLPGMERHFRTVAQPVFYLRPDDPGRFSPPRFPVFTADIKRTGWYGTPANEAGIVKFANHGPGRLLDPRTDRSVTPGERERLHEFLETSFPELSRAPVVGGRVCVYCDTQDGDFWIARHPGRSGLTVAAGGSGHAFKFAPLLGPLIADAVQESPNQRLDRFRWRDADSPRRSEAARFEG